jgi:hypothetical protein
LQSKVAEHWGPAIPSIRVLIEKIVLTLEEGGLDARCTGSCAWQVPDTKKPSLGLPVENYFVWLRGPETTDISQ